MDPSSFPGVWAHRRMHRLDWWAYWNKDKLDFSRPGKPTDNAVIESFNGRVRQECLNENWFLSLEDTQEKLDLWKDIFLE